jgi:RND family efflux transporter MFP subunit
MNRLANLSRTQRILIGTIFVALAVFLGWRLLHTTTVVTESQSLNREVSVASVAALSSDNAPLALIGTVSSVAEASIRSEASGKLRVYRKLGDTVAAGSIIAEFDNAGERAAVLQAEGAYEAAQAGAGKSQSGADISLVSKDQAVTSLNEAKTSALNSVNSTYSAFDDAIRTKTDSAYSNASDRTRKLRIQSSDSRLAMRVEEERAEIETLLQNRSARNTTLSTNSDLIVELTTVNSEAEKVKQYLDDLLAVLNTAIADPGMPQSTIDGLKGSATGARSAVIGQIAGISGAKEQLNAKIAAQTISGHQYDQATQGNQSDLAAAQAGVKSALGVLRGAQARLEKTFVRSPISGSINGLFVNDGDFVSPFTEVAVVANNHALEVVSAVTEDDARMFTVGDKVTIEGGSEGAVTKIAQALDPRTHKIEVKIGITKEGLTKLTNGASVRIDLKRSTPTTPGDSTIKIPLAAVKITPQGAFVFGLSNDNTLVAHKIEMGALLGDQVVVISGITTDMNIVTDARGLKEGMPVIIHTDN